MMLKHTFKKGRTDRTLLLLHGTGGNEFDLLPLAEIVDKDANILGVRGNVLENGMPRFFRRLAEGVFDEKDLIVRTKELYTFIQEAAELYHFDAKKVVAIGYSNGANIAASLLFHYDQAVEAAILHHPMVPLRNKVVPIQHTRVFIAAGKNDPMCPPEEAEDLASMLEQAGADVTLYWEQNGHQLTRTEVEAAKDWL